MVHSSVFFKLFPPPKFLTMPHAGLEISDDALRCISYSMTTHGLVISKCARLELPFGLIEGGDIKNEKQFTDILSSFTRTHKLSYVKVSLPEEKVYLFQVDIPNTNVHVIEQQVEFKLEENVPLSPSEAVFYFDILPASVTGGALRASVSVLSKTYVEGFTKALHTLGMTPLAFEIAAKSIARTAIPAGSEDTEMILHVMNRKTGIYIVCSGVVCFSSTIAWGSRSDDISKSPTDLNIGQLVKEVDRVHDYWTTRPHAPSAIAKIVVVGRDAPVIHTALSSPAIDRLPPISVADVWRNAFDVNTYIPPISRDESFEYGVAAGLALLM